METKKKEVKTEPLTSITYDCEKFDAEKLYYYQEIVEKVRNRLNNYINKYSFKINNKNLKDLKSWCKENYFYKNSNRNNDEEILKKFISLSKRGTKYSLDKDIMSASLSNLFGTITNNAVKNFNQLNNEARFKLLNLFTDKNTLVINFNKIDIAFMIMYSGDERLKTIFNTSADFYGDIAKILYKNKMSDFPETAIEVNENIKQEVKKCFLNLLVGKKNNKDIDEKIFNTFIKEFHTFVQWIEEFNKKDILTMQDIFGNTIRLDLYKGLYKYSTINNLYMLVKLTSSSWHLIFINTLLREVLVDLRNFNMKLNIRMPLQEYFIIDCDSKDKSYIVFKLIEEVSEEICREYDLKVIPNITVDTKF